MIKLEVRLENFSEPIGFLISDDNGNIRFGYDYGYLAFGTAFPISLSLPLRPESFDDNATRAFFQNLFQENDQLEQVMQREQLARDDVVGLLYFLGADCPGSLSCMPIGSEPSKTPGFIGSDYDFLNQQDIDEIVRRLANHEPLPEIARDPSPVAGVQRKIAVVYTPDGRYALPKPHLGVPTTHILKVPGRGEGREARLEAAAAQLANRCGLDVSIPQLVTFQGYEALLINRFDRNVSSEGIIARIHQEDFAQALGLPSRLKYERYGNSERAFNAAAIATVLARTAEPARALDIFLRATIFNLAIGNSDNHAKNHALLYDLGPVPRLAPLYDLLPVRLNGNVTHALSFRIGGAESAENLTLDDFADFFLKFQLTTGAATRFANTRIVRLLAVLDQATENLPGTLKDFNDLIGRELERLIETLRLDLVVRPRDHFDVMRAVGYLARRSPASRNSRTEPKLK